MNRLPVAFLLLSIGCGSAAREGAGRSPAAAASMEDAPCTATVRKVDVSTWREERKPGFVICLPRDWKPSGATWRRGAATMRWGVGIYQEPGSRQAIDRDEGRTSGNFVRRFGEMIDGNWADLWRSRRDGMYRTGVQWSEARVWLTGQSTDAQTADLQVNIYRTVRLIAR